jgi:hypothetical protein
MSLYDFAKKCKSREIMAVLTIILAGFGGFGLGRLSILEKGREPLKIVYPEEISAKIGVQNTETASVSDALSAISNNLPKGGLVVASKNGTKYYFPWCGGVKNITEANKIWFASEDEAKAKGYAPAANCKGLK